MYSLPFSVAPQVKWYRGEIVVKQSRYFRMTAENDVYTLRISEAFPEDEGLYKCVATNNAGTASTSANLRVVGELPVLSKFTGLSLLI